MMMMLFVKACKFLLGCNERNKLIYPSRQNLSHLYKYIKRNLKKKYILLPWNGSQHIINGFGVCFLNCSLFHTIFCSAIVGSWPSFGTHPGVVTQNLGQKQRFCHTVSYLYHYCSWVDWCHIFIHVLLIVYLALRHSYSWPKYHWSNLEGYG